MQLKQQLNRKDKSTGKEFFRYNITIDPKIIQELGWKKGQELEAKISRGKLIISSS